MVRRTTAKQAASAMVAVKSYAISGKQAFNELIASPNSTKISNFLAKSDFQTSSIWTERIFAVICNIICQEKCIRPNYVLSVSDLRAANSRPGKSDYEALEKIATEITDEKIVFTCTVFDNDKDIKAGGGSIAIFTAGLWNNIEKKISISLNLQLESQIINQMKDYTLYNKDEFLALGSVYSQRLYRRLMSEVRLQKSYPTLRISTEELHFLFNTPAGYRKNFTKFEDKILKGAVEDINEKTALKFTYSKHKRGVSIDSILIHFDGSLMIEMDEYKSIEAPSANEY